MDEQQETEKNIKALFTLGARTRAPSVNVTFCQCPSKNLGTVPGNGGTSSKGSTRAPFLGTGTSLNRILSVPALFPHASLRYSKQNGGR